MKIKLGHYLKLFRVKSYVKNLFVFAPLFFNFQFDQITIVNASIVFVLFCLLASSIYSFNDILDLESDKKHPVKKKRPIASGHISLREATFVGGCLMIISLFAAFLLNRSVFFVFIAYIFINVLYNLFLKRIPVFDVFTISLGFVLRILAGSFITDIPASYWILIMTFLLSLFLGFSKRRSDVVLAIETGQSASNIKLFSLKHIHLIMIVFVILIVVVYFAYTISDDVVSRIGSPYVFVTNIFVIIGVLRYLQIIKKSKQYRDPTSIVVGDIKLQIIIGLWILTFIALKYA